MLCFVDKERGRMLFEKAARILAGELAQVGILERYHAPLRQRVSQQRGLARLPRSRHHRDRGRPQRLLQRHFGRTAQVLGANELVRFSST
jgi:hypothetical protein